MVMHNVIEYSSNYSKTSETLWLYCRYKSAVNDESNIADFNVANGADSFNFKLKITDFTDNNGTKNVKIMVPLKYLSNFWRTREMPLINCEVNLILLWFANCVIVSIAVANQGVVFAITDIKLYILAVTLYNVKLLDQLKSAFRRKINWNK